MIEDELVFEKRDKQTRIAIFVLLQPLQHYRARKRFRIGSGFWHPKHDGAGDLAFAFFTAGEGGAKRLDAPASVRARVG